MAMEFGFNFITDTIILPFLFQNAGKILSSLREYKESLIKDALKRNEPYVHIANITQKHPHQQLSLGPSKMN